MVDVNAIVRDVTDATKDITILRHRVSLLRALLQNVAAAHVPRCLSEILQCVDGHGVPSGNQEMLTAMCGALSLLSGGEVPESAYLQATERLCLFVIGSRSLRAMDRLQLVTLMVQTWIQSAPNTVLMTVVDHCLKEVGAAISSPAGSENTANLGQAQKRVQVGINLLVQLLRAFREHQGSAEGSEDLLFVGRRTCMLGVVEGELYPLLVSLYGNKSSAIAPVVLQELVPEVVQFMEAHADPSAHVAAMSRLWPSAVSMLLEDGVHCQTALTLLGQMNRGRGVPEAVKRETNMRQLWEGLRRCLVDPDPVPRKRALELLKGLLGPEEASRHPWAHWLAVYTSLEEFAVHLVKGTWQMLDQLQPQEALCGEDVGLSNNPKATQQSGLILNKDPEQQGGADTLNSEVINSPQDFPWMSILWQRALLHPHPQVRRMTMKTLLTWPWEQRMLVQIPVSFFSSIVLPSYCRALAHQPAPSTYPALGEGGDGEMDLRSLAGWFLQRYMEVQGVKARQTLVLDALNMPDTEEVSQVGLQSLLRCLIEATSHLPMSSEEAEKRGDQPERGGEEGLAPSQWGEEMLCRAGRVLHRLADYPPTHSQRTDYQDLLQLVALTVTAHKCHVPHVAQFLVQLPLPLILPGRPLHLLLKSWLLEGFEEQLHSSSGEEDTPASLPSTWLALASKELFDQLYSKADDQAKLKVQAHTWSTWMMVTADLTEATLSQQILGSLTDRTRQLYTRLYLPAHVIDQTLTIALSLLTMAQAVQQQSGGDPEAAAPAAGGPVFLDLTGRSICTVSDELGSYAVMMVKQYADMLQDSEPRDGSRSKSPCAMEPLEAAGNRAHQAVVCCAVAARLVRQQVTMGQARHWAALQNYRRALEMVGKAVANMDPKDIDIILLQVLSSSCRALVESTTPSTPYQGPSMQLQIGQLIVKVLNMLALHPPGPLHLHAWHCLDALAHLAAVQCPQSPYPPGLRQPGLPAEKWVGDVFVKAVASAQSTPEGGVEPLCRCLRSCWQTLIHHPTLAEDLPPPRITPHGQRKDAPQMVGKRQDDVGRGEAALTPDPSKLQGEAGADLAAEETTCLIDGRGSGQSTDGAGGKNVIAHVCWLAAEALGALVNTCRSRKKRKLAVCVALVNTGILPDVFLLPHFAHLHAAGGPLHFICQQLLAYGQTSRKVMILISARMSQMAYVNPRVISWYPDVIDAILMFGPDESAGGQGGWEKVVEDDVVWGAEGSPFIGSAMDANSTLEVYKSTALAPRVILLCTLYQMAMDHKGKAARHVGTQLFSRLLHRAVHDPSTASDRYKAGSMAHRHRVRIWQAVTILCSFVRGEREAEGNDQAFDDSGNSGGASMGQLSVAIDLILAALNANHPPSVKQYQEATITALLLKKPELMASLLLPTLQSYAKTQSVVGSIILIAAQVLLHGPPALQQQWLQAVVMGIVPWCSAHTHNIRVFAQLVLLELLTRFPLGSSAWSIGEGDLLFLGSFLTYLKTNADIIRLRNTLGQAVGCWSPVGITSPERVFITGVNLVGSPQEAIAYEGCPRTLMEAVTDFLAKERRKLREAAAMLEEEVLGGGTVHSLPAEDLQPDGSDSTQGVSGSEGLLFQRKMVPSGRPIPSLMEGDSLGNNGGVGQLSRNGLQDALALDSEKLGPQLMEWMEIVGKVEGRHDTGGTGSSLKGDLVVVASLVDKVPNLAGLARTCEVFGARCLVVGDLKVTRDSLFASISVTAEKWIPMSEVKEVALAAWLQEQRKKGYTLVGLEQTSQSCLLSSFTFPLHCVLVLGREKEGLSPEILDLMDHTVEIPQVGLLRSLNVHVSGAIAIYEYRRQIMAGAAA